MMLKRTVAVAALLSLLLRVVAPSCLPLQEGVTPSGSTLSSIFSPQKTTLFENGETWLYISGAYEADFINGFPELAMNCEISSNQAFCGKGLSNVLVGPKGSFTLRLSFERNIAETPNAQIKLSTAVGTNISIVLNFCQNVSQITFTGVITVSGTLGSAFSSSANSYDVQFQLPESGGFKLYGNGVQLESGAIPIVVSGAYQLSLSSGMTPSSATACSPTRGKLYNRAPVWNCTGLSETTSPSTTTPQATTVTAIPTTNANSSTLPGTTSSTSTISVTDTTTPQDTTTLPPALNITGSVIIMENSSLPLLTPTIITGNLTVETGGILTLVTDQSTAIAVQSGCVTADPGSILQINLTNANTSTIDVLVQDSNCPTLSFGGVTINKQYGGSGCPIGVQTYNNGKLSVQISGATKCGKKKPLNIGIWITSGFVGVALIIGGFFIFIYFCGYKKNRWRTFTFIFSSAKSGRRRTGTISHPHSSEVL